MSNLYECGTYTVECPRKPYDTQRTFISTALDVLHDHGVGVLEAPTGSGKSMSVIVSVMSWLLGVIDGTTNIDIDKVQALKPRNSSNGSKHDDDPSASLEALSEDVPDFVLQWERKRGRDRLQEEVTRRRDLWSSAARKNSLATAMRRRRNRAGPKNGEEADLDNAPPIEEPTMAPPNVGDDDDDDDEIDDTPYTVPKVIYASRTHSQLAQFLDELKKTPYWTHPRIRVSQVGSRNQCCINADVKAKAQGDGSVVNEMCQELGTDCPYKNNGRIAALRDTILTKSMSLGDIEDIGTLNKTCPYYATRRALPGVQLVVVPYNTLLDPRAREQVGLELTGSVVVLDEAHNVIPACSSAMSVCVPLSALTNVASTIQDYIAKREGQLLLRSKARLHEVSSVLARLSSFLLQRLDADSASSPSVVLSVLNLVQHSGIGQYNLFTLVEFMENSRADKKLGAMTATRHVNRVLRALAEDQEDNMVVVSRKDRTLKVCALSALKTFAPLVCDSLALLLVGGTLPPLDILKLELFPAAMPKTIHHVALPHVVPARNVNTICCGVGPTGVPLTFTYAAKGSSGADMMAETGRAVLNLSRLVPGGLIVFFSSYSYVEEMINAWRDSGLLTDLEGVKPVQWERRDQNVDHVLYDYRAAVDKDPTRGAVLLGVMGGKLSEGINFSDHYGRCVVVVGLPYANPNDVEINAKLDYLRDRKSNNTDSAGTVDRMAYFDAQCMTVVNQTIGRVIRHANDHATIILLDSRATTPRIRGLLPHWVQRNCHVATEYIQLIKSTRSVFETINTCSPQQQPTQAAPTTAATRTALRASATPFTNATVPPKRPPAVFAPSASLGRPKSPQPVVLGKRTKLFP
eukprot:PhM_4_TR5700/c0_g1_i2/m.94731/K11273/DDX11, CHL1, CTF1; chromosome transmission fidelity protein 1